MNPAWVLPIFAFGCITGALSVAEWHRKHRQGLRLRCELAERDRDELAAALVTDRTGQPHRPVRLRSVR